MSTRANIGFRFKEQDWMMYHHSDGGMAWLGLSLLKFCRELDLGVARNRVTQFQSVDWYACPTPAQIAKFASAQNWEQAAVDEMLRRRKSKKTEERLSWDDMFREGCELSDFMNALNFWPENNSFIWDFSCEWAYIINLDTEKLEVYTHHYRASHHESRGRPKVRPKGRYCEPREDEDSEGLTRGVTLLDEIPLKDIREIPEFALMSFAKRIDRQY